MSKLSLSESEGGGLLKRAMTPTRSDRPSRPSTPSQVWKHAAKRLQPVLKAMVAFAANREFEKRPSHYRLQVAEKQHGAVTLTVCYCSVLLQYPPPLTEAEPYTLAPLCWHLRRLHRRPQRRRRRHCTPRQRLPTRLHSAQRLLPLPTRRHRPHRRLRHRIPAYI